MEDEDKRAHPARLRAPQSRSRSQLVWRAARTPTKAELTVDAPPIYRQGHVHPKALIDDLRNGREKEEDLFGHFGLTEEDREARSSSTVTLANGRTGMILGDALQVMASLAEREGPARPGAGDLYRPALRHPLQFQLPVVDHLARRQGRQARPPNPVSPAR